MEYKEFFAPGMGTESAAPFLRSLVRMIRPQRTLEVGAGYTTPFLLEGLEKNNEILDEGNLDKRYVDWHQENYNPRLVVVDTMDILNVKGYMEFEKGDFKGKSQELFEKYGYFDFVWFDCGGAEEYDAFMREYWDICSEYVLFHYTYYQGKPTQNLGVVLQHITGHEQLSGGSNVQRIDFIEPHKEGQGSITMFKKIKEYRRTL